MTSFGIVDFIANNSLDEVGATPVWEKFRKHFYAVGVGISLFALYFTLGIRVECAPAYSNGTVIKIDLYSRHVNEYCGNNDQLIVFRYSGCMLVGMNAIILLAASYWLYLPNAINPLRNFSKIRGLVNDINLPWEELKQLMATPMTAEELLTTPNEPTDKLLKQKKIREIIKLLPSFKEKRDHDRQKTTGPSSCCCRSLKCPCKTLVASYLFRNCVLGVLFILAIAGIVYLTILMLQTGYTFPCKYDLTSDGKNYICAVGGTSVAIVCTIVCVPLLVCQLIAIGYGSAQAIKIILNENRKDEKRKKINYSSVRLIVRFCKSSQSPRSGISSSFIEFFFSKEFEETVNRNVNISEIRSDDELGKLSRALYIDEDPLRDLTSDMREYETTQFRGIVDITKYSLRQYYKLAEMLAKHQLWETFVFLLGNINGGLRKCSQEDLNDFSTLMINFDSIATKYHDGKKLSKELYETRSHSQYFDSNSILYYAIHYGNMDNFDVALFLLSRFKPIKPFVHYYVPKKNNLHSLPALTYLELLPPTYRTSADYNTLKSEIEKCNTATQNPEYKCQKALKDTLAVYKEKGQDMQSIIIGILSSRKFREWDETASEFLKLAAEKGHDEIELALLKAFFPGNPLRYLCKKDDGVKKSIPSDRCIEKIFNDFNYELDDCKYLVAHLAETHSWSLFVRLLNHTNTRCDEMTPEQNEFFRNLKIDLQVPQQNSNSSGCGENIVCTALEQNRRRDGIQFTVMNFLLEVSEPQILYVIKAGLDTKRLSKDPRSNPQNTQEDSKKFKDALAKFEFTSASPLSEQH